MFPIKVATRGAIAITFARACLFNNSPSWRLIASAGIKNYKPPKKFDDVEFPAERRRLRPLERAPQPVNPGERMPRHPRNLIDIRGPEETHTKLIHEQFGVRANLGGNVRWGHLEMIRLTVTRKMDESRMFAIWRVDPPWKAVTKKGTGHRMGGGKGSINHYVTPIKAGRVIFELAGYCEFEEVYPLLRRVAAKLPFPAEAISQEMLVKEQALQKQMDEENLNPFNFEYCLENNVMGSQKWASPYDFMWHGKYR